jgi:anti-anti-sigma factor
MGYSVVPPSQYVARNLRSTLTIPPVRADRNGSVVFLHGEADLSTRNVLSDALSRVIASEDTDVVIDLADAEFIDSATVRVLAECKKVLDRRIRRLTLRSPSKLAARVLDMYGLTDLIEGRGESSP